MKLKIYLLFSLCIFMNILHAQVGIGNTSPNATLDVSASNVLTPSNTDGVLIPRIDAFPITNPGISQKGMLVFLNNTVGVNLPGFYYWDGISTWIGLNSTSSSDSDWFKVGTTTAPTLITDSMFHTGNIAIGKNTTNFPLDILTTTFDTSVNNTFTNNTTNTINKIGANNLLNGTTNDDNFGTYNNLIGTGSGSHSGTYNYLTGSGTGSHYGNYSYIAGSGTGQQIGTRNTIFNDRNGIHYGTLNTLNEAGGTGAHYGTSNSIGGGGTGEQYGVLNTITNTGNNLHYGVNNILSSAGTGNHFGVSSTLSGAGTGTQYGENITITNTSDSNHFGVNNTLSGTGLGIHYGINNSLSGAGTGIQYGTSNSITNTSDSNHFGVNNTLSGTGLGIHYGINNSLSGAGTGIQYGTSNSITNTSDSNHFGVNNTLSGTGLGIHYGINNSLSGTGTGIQYGTSNSITNSSNSNHFGVNNSLSGTGTGAHFGINNSLSGIGDGTQYGNYNNINNTGNGAHYGSYNNILSTGTGSRYGVYTSISNSGTANQFGSYTDLNGVGSGTLFGSSIAISNNGNGIHYANYTDIIGAGNGAKYGNANYDSNAGSGTHYGTFSSLSGAGTGQQHGSNILISNTGNANHYANYSILSGSGSGIKYGYYNLIDPIAGGTHYGIYSEVLKAGTNYAGYFLGKVSIGTTIANNYIFPSSRGTIGQIMQTDGTGNVTWVAPTALSITETDPQVTSTTTNIIPKWNGTTLVDGIVTDDGTNVGVGIAPSAGNKLEVAGKTKTTNFQMTTGAAANSILQSDATGNASWQSLNGFAWGILGNYGTVAATNFIGTTDDVDFVIKRNGIRAGYIGDPTGVTNVPVLDRRNTSFGANSLLNPATGYRNTAIGSNIMTVNTTGSRNVAIGDAALLSNTSGIENTAIGVGALASNTTNLSNTAVGRNTLTNSTADYNTAIGDRSLTTNTTGTLNTGIGVSSLRLNTTGSNNSANGVFSLRSNTTGSNNTALGYQSLYSNTTGSGNVGLGYQAGYSETASDKLYIENSNADANNALVYGDFSANILRTNSQFQIGNPAVTGYAFPISRGTVNQVLQTDGVGNTNWVAPSTLAITETDPQVSSVTSNTIPKWNGTTLVDGIVKDDGTNVGVGIVPSAGNKLEVAGKTKTTDFQMTTGATTGYVMQSDASGNASWVNSNTLAITETDPQVTSTITNKIPKWNGTTLVDGVVTDDGTNVGVGIAPSAGNKLEVSGKTKTTDFQMTIGATTGYVMQSDATGNASWVNSNTKSIIRTNLNASQSLSNGGWQLVTFNTVVLDTNSEFNTGTSRFTATKAGYYQINSGIHTNDQSNTDLYSIGVRKNGAFYQQTTGNHSNLGPVSRNINCVVNLAIGDYIEIFVENYQSGVTVDGFAGKSFLEIIQIQ